MNACTHCYNYPAWMNGHCYRYPAWMNGHWFTYNYPAWLNGQCYRYPVWMNTLLQLTTILHEWMDAVTDFFDFIQGLAGSNSCCKGIYTPRNLRQNILLKLTACLPFFC